MASEKEQIIGLKYARFDPTRVSEIDRCIRAYSVGPNEYPGVADNAELVQHWHDICNAGNAWKYALLLYISRVFSWDRTTDSRLPEVTSLSRLVLDSVRCCRAESPLQKQLLFPCCWQVQNVWTHMDKSLSKYFAKNGIENVGIPCFEKLWGFYDRSGPGEIKRSIPLAFGGDPLLAIGTLTFLNSCSVEPLSNHRLQRRSASWTQW